MSVNAKINKQQVSLRRGRNALRISLLMALLMFQHISFSQQSEELNRVMMLLDDSSYRVQISPVLNYNINSNSISNRFVDNALSGGYISDEYKNELSEKLEEENTLGYELLYGVEWKIIRAIRDMNLYGGFYSKEIFYSQFNQSVFPLLLKGNAFYSGGEVELSPFQYTYITYEDLFVGIEGTGINEKVQFRAGVSLLKGSNFQEIILEDTRLFTSSSGDSIHLNTDMDYIMTPMGKKRATSFYGWGSAIHGSVSCKIKQHKLAMRVKDLGFINWKESGGFHVQRSLAFTGITVDNILDSVQTGEGIVNPDSLEQLLGTERIIRKRKYWLPAEVGVEYSYTQGKLLNAYISIQYRFHSFYKPRIEIANLFLLPHSFVVKPVMAYGGYGQFDFGLGMYKSFSGKYLVGFDSWFMEDVLVPDESSGQGVRFFGVVGF